MLFQLHVSILTGIARRGRFWSGALLLWFVGRVSQKEETMMSLGLNGLGIVFMLVAAGALLWALHHGREPWE